MKTEKTFAMTAIGAVRQRNGECSIEIAPGFRAGLAGIEEFSHVIVCWLFDRAPWDGKTLVMPPCYKKLDHDIGLFATRGPFRPNPLAISVCRLVSLDREAGKLVVDWIDAEPDSPVIDLKPYHPSSDVVTSFAMPAWCSHWPKSREMSGSFDWGKEFIF